MHLRKRWTCVANLSADRFPTIAAFPQIWYKPDKPGAAACHSNHCTLCFRPTVNNTALKFRFSGKIKLRQRILRDVVAPAALYTFLDAMLATRKAPETI
jgi:hypothetical protein